MDPTTDLIETLPPEIASYAVVVLIVWYLTRRAYRESTEDRGTLLDRYEQRLDQLERSHEGIAQELQAAREAEQRCLDRMAAMETRYERRINALESGLREVSSPEVV